MFVHVLVLPCNCRVPLDGLIPHGRITIVAFPPVPHDSIVSASFVKKRRRACCEGEVEAEASIPYARNKEE
jgi:hypothetical protein